MGCDLLIKNGKLIDGTGAPARPADLAVTNGRITAIADRGKAGTDAKRVIDAEGRVVAPGFVDPHTHYDAQLCWDRELAPTSWHGITSVVVGNCGVGIAPCRPEGREIALRDLVNVEGIPYDVLKGGVTWDWQSFPEFMNAAERRGTAINVGFYAPLTPFRHFVMREASMDRAATPEETAQIRALIKEAVAAGALGFSTTKVPQHLGYGGKPLACQNASLEEYAAYCGALKELGKGVISIALMRQTSILSDEERALLQLMSDAGGRPITFIGLLWRDDVPEAIADSVAKLGALGQKKVYAQTSPLPLMRQLSLRRPYIYSGFPSWKPAIKGTAEEQIALYRDPGFRARFREDLKLGLSTAGNWSALSVVTVFKESLKRFEGSSIADIARELGKDGVDTLLDIGLEDDLKTEFSTAAYNYNVEGVKNILNTPGILIGLGDGGAHLDVSCDVGYTSYLLGTWVRERGVMSLEEGVRMITSAPADFLGLHDRGRLVEGKAADIVIFDETTIAAAKKLHKASDLPGGASRLMVRSIGIDYTVVNGEVTWQDGALTGARAGQILRS